MNLLIILFLISINVICFGEKEPSSDYEARVVLYLMDNGMSEEDAYKATRGNGAQVVTDRNGTYIRKWDVEGIERPNDYNLPPVQHSKDILYAPKDERKQVNGKWEKKSVDEIQSEKSDSIKRLENKIMQNFWDEGIIDPLKKHLEPQHWDAMYTHLEDQPDNKFTKLNKDVTLLEKKGGDVNDIYWHDDV